MSTFLSTSEYLSLPRDPQRWVIKDLIPTGGLVNLYGKPKTGKSFVALGMGAAVSGGLPEWNGFEVRKHGPVAYLQIDTPRGEWAGRCLDIKASGLNLDGIKHCDMNMVKFYPFDIREPEHFNWFQSEMAALQPVVVFIDTIRESHDGDENDSKVMKHVITNFIVGSRPAAVVLLSHSRKDNMFSGQGGDDLMADARGSSYMAGKMDVVIKMTGNSQHATGMQYKGRSAGHGRVAVTQDEDTGLVLLDGEDAKYQELVRVRVAEMRQQNPKVSVNKMAETIAEETKHRKKRTIQENIKAMLNE
jgi:RecA-family ATPase